MSPAKTRHHRAVKNFLPLLAVVVSALFATGCVATKVDSGGGFTAKNTNVNAIIAAANDVFPQYGYSVGPVNYPDSISFDKPAGAFGKLLYGSYGVTTTMRAKLVMTPVGANNYRLSAKLSRVSDAGEAGFEEARNMPLWSGEFNPILRQIASQAGGAGPM